MFLTEYRALPPSCLIDGLTVIDGCIVPRRFLQVPAPLILLTCYHPIRRHAPPTATAEDQALKIHNPALDVIHTTKLGNIRLAQILD